MNDELIQAMLFVKMYNIFYFQIFEELSGRNGGNGSSNFDKSQKMTKSQKLLILWYKKYFCFARNNGIQIQFQKEFIHHIIMQNSMILKDNNITNIGNGSPSEQLSSQAFEPGSELPDVENICKRKKKKTSKKKQNSKFRQGRWSCEEELIYIQFLQQNDHLFSNEYIRRSNKVFDQLSKLLGSRRSSDQCRSHHHKMRKQTSFTTLGAIVQYLISKYPQLSSEPRNSVKVEPKTSTEIVIAEQKTANYTLSATFDGCLSIKLSICSENLIQW